MLKTAASASAASESSFIWRRISAHALPYFTNIPAIKTLSATGPSLAPVIWKLSPGCAEKQFRLRQSFQSALPISGRPWGPRCDAVKEKLRRKCSIRGCASEASLSKSTDSLRILQSPVSRRYASVPAMSHRGSSLNPLPTARFPFFVRGWY